ncbi:hypothetical protein AAG570_012101 [Ranatra chinensis]|uniref:Uncharacterized protein n=1 Tax=Ranatra chinensis TaxID=642074 RepID=A0ABD0YHT9_9HEMI
MAELGDSSDMNSSETSRRQLHHQNRTIARLLGDTDLHRLRKDAPSALAHLRLRAQWLSNSEDVRLGLEKAEYLFNEVDSVAKTLEELVEKRKEKLRDIARVKALEHETEQVRFFLSQFIRLFYFTPHIGVQRSGDGAKNILAGEPPGEQIGN